MISVRVISVWYDVAILLACLSVHLSVTHMNYIRMSKHITNYSQRFVS